jgi:hypothetical protein
LVVGVIAAMLVKDAGMVAGVSSVLSAAWARSGGASDV